MRTLCRQWNQFIVFQFHKGTIKTEREESSLSSIRNFNSIKVRLKPIWKFRFFDVCRLFQFHKGTIKTSGFFTL